MRNGLRFFGIIVVVTLIGLSVTGCASDPSINRGGWSEYVFTDGEYLVVGTVVVRDVSRSALLANLMEEAIRMGAHDIINVRVGTTDRFGLRVRAATAVAIRYTNELVLPDPPRVVAPPVYIPAEPDVMGTVFVDE